MRLGWLVLLCFSLKGALTSRRTSPMQTASDKVDERLQGTVPMKLGAKMAMPPKRNVDIVRKNCR